MTIDELKITTYLYAKFSNDDEHYRLISDKNLNFENDDDLALLLRFLRSWGCRQFANDYGKESSNALKSWYKNNETKIPKATQFLFNLSDIEIYQLESVFNELMYSFASIAGKRKNIKKTVGPVGAAKALFALRKNIFPPWDNPIIKNLNFEKNGAGYCNFLIFVKNELLHLKGQCIKTIVRTLL